MRFTPKTENEIKSMNLVDNGIYDYLVVGAEDKVSAKGNDMIELKLQIWDINGHERIVFDYLLESIAHKLRHFAEHNGLLDKYESGVLLAEHCLNKSGKVEIVIQKDKTGQYADRNAVKDYIGNVSVKSPLTKPIQPANDFVDSNLDDLPF